MWLKEFLPVICLEQTEGLCTKYPIKICNFGFNTTKVRIWLLKVCSYHLRSLPLTKWLP